MAVYLHNAIWTTDPFGNPTSHPHNRNLSSLSNTTLRTVTSEQSSHPTEPLLRSTTSESLAYLDLLSRQPTHPDGPQAGWDLGLNFEGDQTTMQERKVYHDKSMRRRIRRLRLAKSILELVMGGWAIYNIVRYFRAYMTYSSSTGLIVSLVLGTATTLSLAFLLTASLLAYFRPYLLMHDVPLDYLLRIRDVLLYSSSFLLVAPALVSFALVFVWKNSPDTQLRLENRCYLDIDVVWSISTTTCMNRQLSWSLLLLLSIIRVILTVLNILFYHLLSREYHNTRRPSSPRKSHSIRPAHHQVSVVTPTRPLPRSNSSLPLSTQPHPTHSQISIPTTVRQSNVGSDRPALRNSRSRGSIARYSRSRTDSSTSVGRPTSDSPKLSEKDLGTSNPTDMYPGLDPTMPPGVDNTTEETVQQQQHSDSELKGFVDRFRSLVSQITQETEDALAIATHDADTPSTPSSDSSTDSSPYSTSRGIGGREDDSFSPYVFYGQEPQQHVRVLGGIVIRRMPTIESLGSHEAQSSSYHGEGGVVSSAHSFRSTRSRPPTHSTPSSSSHANSMYTNVSHHLVPVHEQKDTDASEMGELVRDRQGSGDTNSIHTTPSRSPSPSDSLTHVPESSC